MLVASDIAPEEALKKAAELAPEDVHDLIMSEAPVLIHRMQSASDGGWEKSLPLVGWYFPVFTQDGELTGASWLNAPVEAAEDLPPSRYIRKQEDEDLFEAFETACGIGENANGESRVRIVHVPGHTEAFWVEAANDTFIPVTEPRVMSAPEFFAFISSDGEGPFEDIIKEYNEENA